MDVRQGTPAALHGGLHAGDIFISVDGTPVSGKTVAVSENVRATYTIESQGEYINRGVGVMRD